MAQRMRIELVDDLTGGQAAETITFSLDGVSYEIDLSEENSAALRADMDKYVTAGRRTGGRVRKGRADTASKGRDLEKVRTWARENGYEVKDRGRVSTEVMQAYENATS